MIPIKNKTHFSILKALTKPKQLVDFAQKYNLPAIGITDLGNMSGVVEFTKEAKSAGIKPIIGVEFDDYTLIAKSLAGYRNLIKICCGAELAEHTDGLIFISNNFVPALIECQTPIEDWKHQAYAYVAYYKEMFGEDNFYLGVGIEPLVIQNMVREIAKSTGSTVIATGDSFYPYEADCLDHQILLCIGEKTHLKNLSIESSKFSDTCQYCLPTKERAESLYSAYEIAETYEILNKIEDFNILRKPSLPVFCENELDRLKELCREGWKAKISNKENIETYKDRILSELSVLTSEPILITYFLIVHDYILAARNRGELLGVGRGSSGGSLVSYLLDIIRVDPIQYGLIFERFYNAGRNSPDKVSLPDIDTDFPSDKRENTIQYIKNKYGEHRVAQLGTFGTLKGRQSLKDVIKAHDIMSFEEINHLTKEIPDEAAISDELQEMKEATGEQSIIRWAIENNPDYFADFVKVVDGELVGDLAHIFAQAIRLEDTKRNRSRHASGIVVADIALDDITPLFIEPSGEKIVAVEMGDAEALGLVKVDILGVAVLKKLTSIQNLINKRHFSDTNSSSHQEPATV